MFSNNQLKEIYNQYREKKLAHAYLIETNNMPKLETDLKDLIKALNCPAEYKEGCQECNFCNLINKDNLTSLKIITPEGTSIKKTKSKN